MTEESVYINLFLNENNPLEVLFKLRMTDFIVEEVDE